LAGRRVPAGTRIVLWTEPGGFRATDFGERRGAVRQVVLHYDAAGTSARCFAVLERRGLSCHFLLDLDGTVYQTLDVAGRAYHAAEFNDGSVGIEIANLGAYPTRDKVGAGARRGRVHGVELWQEEYTDAQYEALARLVAALCRELDVPLEAPAAKGVLPKAAGWRGILGHYHLTTQKVDPGPAFDWDRFLDLARRR
jgi:N-acetyl-anhydromuramyl-L-alanine amidase AmpD